MINFEFGARRFLAIQRDSIPFSGKFDELLGKFLGVKTVNITNITENFPFRLPGIRFRSIASNNFRFNRFLINQAGPNTYKIGSMKFNNCSTQFLQDRLNDKQQADPHVTYEHRTDKVKVY